MYGPLEIKMMRKKLLMSQREFGKVLGTYRDNRLPFTISQVSGAECGRPRHLRASKFQAALIALDTKIGKRIGVSREGRRNLISTISDDGTAHIISVELRKCAICDTMFAAKSSTHAYCSEACRREKKRKKRKEHDGEQDKA